MAMPKRPRSEAVPEERLRRWHRLFGLMLTDFLSDSPFAVELEMDLSQRQQFLDVAIVRRLAGSSTRPLPDGLDDLVAHNRITFKSYREALSDWALKELTGHYVNYRKQVSPRGQLIAEDQFRMYAVCARRPRDLFASVPPEPLRPGVYTCRRGTDAIRIVVAAELPREKRNALLHLFSAAPERVQYGAEHYRMESGDISSIVNDLLAEYSVEGLPMPYTMADYRREKALEMLSECTVEERLAGLSAEQLTAALSQEQLVEALSSEQFVAALSPEQTQAILKRLKTKSAPAKKKPKREG